MASHMETAHRWALDDQSKKPLKSFNMFQEWGPMVSGISGDKPDNIIFSHGRHFPIAAFTTLPSGERVVLFTTQTYSVSTSKHINYTRRAIPSRVRVLECEHVSPMHKPGGSENFHADNIASLLNEGAKAYEASKRRRSEDRRAWDIATANRKFEAARNYALEFDLEAPTGDLADMAAKVAELNAAKAETLRLAKLESDRRQAEYIAQRKLDDADAFKAWSEGVSGSRCPSSYTYDENRGAYLRRSPDGSDLETSQGASVPWEHALQVFRFVKLIRERGETWNRNGHSVRVGHYNLDQIRPDGSFVAGCHLINWPEIERLAIKEGVFDIAPSAQAEIVTEGAH